MELWAWAILLLSVGLALAILELFVPSGGLIGFLALAALLGAVILAFMDHALTGLAILAVAILGVPTVVVLGLKWWPHTPIGKRVLLAAPDSREVLPDDPQRRALKSLVGKVGRAKSSMLPSGPVLIEGRTVDAVSEGVPIEPGTPVQVVAVHGAEVTVRPVDEATAHRASQPTDDVLSQPIESVLPDPFEEPPA